MDKFLSIFLLSSSTLLPYKDVDQVFWYDSSSVLIVSDLTVYRYNVEKKEEKVLKYIEKNTVVGEDGIECSFKQFVKRDIEDVATSVYVDNKQYDFKDSVVPVYCNSEYVYLTNAFDFLEEIYLKVSVKDGNIEKIEEEEIQEVIENIQTLNDMRVYISESGYVEVKKISQSLSSFLEHSFSNCIDLILSKLSDLNLLHIQYQR